MFMKFLAGSAVLTVFLGTSFAASAQLSTTPSTGATPRLPGSTVNQNLPGSSTTPGLSGSTLNQTLPGSRTTLTLPGSSTNLNGLGSTFSQTLPGSINNTNLPGSTNNSTLYPLGSTAPYSTTTPSTIYNQNSSNPLGTLNNPYPRTTQPGSFFTPISPGSNFNRNLPSSTPRSTNSPFF